MHRYATAADHNQQFDVVEIRVPYMHKKEIDVRTYKVHFCPALDAVKGALEDVGLRKHLIRYPERHYIRKPGTDENMRVWSDMHTADDWWELQVNVMLFIMLLMLSRLC
jgi:hypothetical protein